MTVEQIALTPRKTALPLATTQALAKYSLVLSDLLAFALAGLLANTLHWLRPSIDTATYIGLWAGERAQDRAELLLPLFIIAIAWFWLLGHYTRRRPFWGELADILRVLLLLAMLDAALQ